MLDETCHKELFIYEQNITDSSTVLTKDIFQATSISTIILLSATTLILQNAWNQQVEHILFANPMLPNCNQLYDIYLSNCYIINKTVKYLAQFCSQCHLLSRIVLYNNNLDTDMLIQIFNILKTMTSLKEISVYEVLIPSSLYLTLVQQFIENSAVALLLVNEECLVGLRINEQQLIEVDISLAPFYQILLQNCNIYANIAAIINNSIYLEKIYIKDSINEANTVSIKIFTALKCITSLNVIHLSNNNLSEAEAEELAAVISVNNSLEVVCLNNNHLGSSTVLIAKALKNHSMLLELDLNHNCYHKCEELVSEIASVIPNNKYMKKLRLRNNHLHTEGVILICKALSVVSNLKIIDFRQNNITKGAAEALACVISNNVGLEELYLGYNQLESGASQVAKALTNISSIRVLGIEHNDLSEEIVDDLAAAIKANTSLEKLWLNGNNFGYSTVVIFNALKELSTIKKLNLDDNESKSQQL